MGKFDELSEEQLASLPDDVKQSILDGQNELKGARNVIGDLNKKIKSSTDTPPNNGGISLTNEELLLRMNEAQEEKNFNNFMFSNPIFDDHKEELKTAVKFYKGDIERAKNHVLNENPTLANNFKSNQTGVGGGNSTGYSTWTGLVDLSTYQKMNTEEKSLYLKNCKENGQGGLMLKSDSVEVD